MGMMAGRQMTREEAMMILGIDVEDESKELKDDEGNRVEGLNPEDIMERFDTLIEKNQLEKGGSFYIQSKVYWAKQQLMQDHPAELNKSDWNPDTSGKKAMDKEEEEPEQPTDKKEEEKK